MPQRNRHPLSACESLAALAARPRYRGLEEEDYHPLDRLMASALVTGHPTKLHQLELAAASASTGLSAAPALRASFSFELA